LIDLDCGLEYTETVRPKNKYGQEEAVYTDWYISREFDDSEIRLLIDSILFSRHISYAQCKELITKLENLSSPSFETDYTKHIRNMPDKTRGNKQLFHTIKTLDEAISKRKKVAFNYIEYGIDKKPYPRKNKHGKPTNYIVSPYQMVATNGRYYLICNHYIFNNVTYFRLDRIKDIKLLEEDSKPMKDVVGLEKGLNLPKHMAERVYMFSGESVQVKFRVKQSIISDILDWFGFDVHLKKEDDDFAIATVSVNEQAMFYWSLQYFENVEILSPLTLRNKLYETSKGLVKKYKDKK